MDIFEIIAQKSWEQLSEQELVQLSEMGIDQQHFSMLKQNWSDFANQPSLEPAPEMKSSLDAAFAQQYGESGRAVAGYWKWMAAAAVGLLIVGVGVSVFNGPEEPVQLAKVEQEQQTIQAEGSVQDTNAVQENPLNPVSADVTNSAKVAKVIESESSVSTQDYVVANYKAKSEEVNNVSDEESSKELAANTRMVRSAEARQIAPAVAPTLDEKTELISASSSNSTQNSVLAYRKMKEEESTPTVVFESFVTKAVSLNDLNVKFKGLIQLY